MQQVEAVEVIKAMERKIGELSTTLCALEIQLEKSEAQLKEYQDSTSAVNVSSDTHSLSD